MSSLEEPEMISYLVVADRMCSKEAKATMH